MGSRGDKKPSMPSGSRLTIRTLPDLNRSSETGSNSDSDRPQEVPVSNLFGMLVQDPLKGGYDVDAIFEQARQMGAMQGPFQPQSSSSRSFTGTGRHGFAVNDGALRRFDDPENASFLEVL
ncbi:unnamed protein product [Musa banksii]